MTSRPAPLYCFSHVQKAGGTTVEAVLRRHFGIRHMLVNPPVGWRYEASDLAADLRLNPLTRSIASHWLRPFIRYGRFEPRMVWTIFLREPVSRFISHFQYHNERMGSRRPFSEWMQKRKFHNWQTRFLAGEEDIGAARQLLEERYSAVGLLERFDESLLLLRRALRQDDMNVFYGQPHNPRRGPGTREQLLAEHGEACAEYNQLDLELYDFAVNQLFPRQVAAYGEQKLLEDKAAAFAPRSPSPAERLREFGYLALRHAVHLPMDKRRRKQAVAAGRPVIRE